MSKIREDMSEDELHSYLCYTREGKELMNKITMEYLKAKKQQEIEEDNKKG